MPAKSKSQQQLFGLALSVKRGETPRSEVSDEVLDIVDSMSEKEIKDFAETEHKGLPDKKEGIIRLKDLIESENIDESFSHHAFTTIQELIRMSGVRDELDDVIEKNLGRDWKQKFQNLANDLKKMKL